jgi:hypothetical protein
MMLTGLLQKTFPRPRWDSSLSTPQLCPTVTIGRHWAWKQRHATKCQPMRRYGVMFYISHGVITGQATTSPHGMMGGMGDWNFLVIRLHMQLWASRHSDSTCCWIPSQLDNLHSDSRRLPTAATQVRAQVIWDLWWKKWHSGRFSPSISVSPANYHSTDCSTSIIIYHPGLVQ